MGYADKQISIHKEIEVKGGAQNFTKEDKRDQQGKFSCDLYVIADSLFSTLQCQR